MNARTLAVERAPLLAVENLVKHYPTRRGWRAGPPVKAADGISFDLEEGETLGLVGESGCGKSTAAKTLLRLIEPTAGRIMLEGTDLARLPAHRFRRYRREMQMVFQDPYASLNPRMRAGDIVAEPLRNFGWDNSDGPARVADLFGRVGLPADAMRKYPHEFSGGQRQRLGIARALALRPKLIVCDEPVSALDVSIQAQVINLLEDLQDELKLSYLFVAHDLAVVRHISHRVAVMYLGRIVEIGPVEDIYARPRHPYTRALLSAVPKVGGRGKGERMLLKGDLPSPANPPSGCAFRTRCPFARAECAERAPQLSGDGAHRVACHFADQIA
ncbi:ABC transporter ATP-binding protein [Pseudothauera rhizosphaerae]|uniref:Dipeptide ABC transporter ATP-binding protein n=1 Tax=Pseudothauera rhizosphaerae TaxID=2565932 RepID=A0A4S4AR89_9RHOO|nr:dipeptide ABC transporter ATP-binding protein [Pseudothauera rhizosphaerae]THF62237.1 dipeptide ABC transporter ATP-binding protein [Pseudothauera rhizosphaerae]